METLAFLPLASMLLVATAWTKLSSSWCLVQRVEKAHTGSKVTGVQGGVLLRSKAVRAVGAKLDSSEPWLRPSLPFVDPVSGGVVRGQGRGFPLIDRLRFCRLLLTTQILLCVPNS